MKLGYLSKNSHELEKLRNTYLIQKFGYKLLNKISLRDLIKIRPLKFYTDDHISFFELIKLAFALKTKIIKSVVIRCSELYTIDYNAYNTEVEKYLSELKLSNGNVTLKKIWAKRIYVKIWFFKIVLNSNNSILLLPSILRKNYFLSNFSKSIPIIVIRNLPMKNELNFIKVNLKIIFDQNLGKIIESGNYFLLAGNINSYEDLNVVAQYSKKFNIPIIIASSDSRNSLKIQELFPTTIYYIGIVEHNIILNLVYNCKYGIILYNNSTINQKFSASSKLFEFLYFNKSVVVSNNIGVKNELILESYPHKLINESNLIDNNFHFKDDNSKFIFENEILKLNDILTNHI